MTNITAITQKITQAQQGQTLLEIVDYTVFVSFTALGWGVQLLDLATGHVIASQGFGPQLNPFGSPESGLLPTTNNPPVMGSQPLYLEFDVGHYDINLLNPFVIDDRKALQPITLSGGPGGGGGGGSQIPIAIALGGIAIAGVAGVAILRTRRNKRGR